MHITSSRLRVDVAVPGTVYRGSRFDWTGFVTQVELDGVWRFCVPEALDGTGTGGVGLCNEFITLDDQGFEETPPGEWFPKFGVGLIRKPDNAPYAFAHHYEVRPFPARCSATPESATFELDPLPMQGYAVRQTKRLTAVGNRLTVEYTLANVGERAVHSLEYVHNFVAINDGHTQGYEVSAPFDLDGWAWPDTIHAAGRTATWRHAPKKAVFVPMEPLPVGVRGHTLKHLPTGVTLTEEVDRDLAKLTVWGTDRVISTEAFVAVDVAPGESFAWHRTFTFDVHRSDSASVG